MTLQVRSGNCQSRVRTSALCPSSPSTLSVASLMTCDCPESGSAQHWVGQSFPLRSTGRQQRVRWKPTGSKTNLPEFNHPIHNLGHFWNVLQTRNLCRDLMILFGIQGPIPRYQNYGMSKPRGQLDLAKRAWIENKTWEWSGDLVRLRPHEAVVLSITTKTFR